MIGQFRYSTVADRGIIAVKMRWIGREAMALVHVPDDIAALARDAQYVVLRQDEAIGLPFALGYGVTLALLSDRSLCLTGDATVWQEKWGRLNRVN